MAPRINIHCCRHLSIFTVAIRFQLRPRGANAYQRWWVFVSHDAAAIANTTIHVYWAGRLARIGIAKHTSNSAHLRIPSCQQRSAYLKAGSQCGLPVALGGVQTTTSSMFSFITVTSRVAIITGVNRVVNKSHHCDAYNTEFCINWYEVEVGCSCHFTTLRCILTSKLLSCSESWQICKSWWQHNTKTSSSNTYTYLLGALHLAVSFNKLLFITNCYEFLSCSVGFIY